MEPQKENKTSDKPMQNLFKMDEVLAVRIFEGFKKKQRDPFTIHTVALYTFIELKVGKFEPERIRKAWKESQSFNSEWIMSTNLIGEEIKEYLIGNPKEVNITMNLTKKLVLYSYFTDLITNNKKLEF